MGAKTHLRRRGGLWLWGRGRHMLHGDNGAAAILVICDAARLRWFKQVTLPTTRPTRPQRPLLAPAHRLCVIDSPRKGVYGSAAVWSYVGAIWTMVCLCSLQNTKASSTKKNIKLDWSSRVAAPCVLAVDCCVLSVITIELRLAAALRSLSALSLPGRSITLSLSALRYGARRR